MRNLFLTDVNPAQRVIAIRAVRLALMAAGMDGVEAMNDATSAVLRVLRGDSPVGLIGDTAPEGTVEAAVEAFTNALKDHPDAATFAVDVDYGQAEVSEAEPEAPEPDSWETLERRFLEPVPADFEPSARVARTLATLMAATDGSAQRAWVYAKLLAWNTGDHDLYVEVNHLLTQSFALHKVAVDA